MIPYPHIDPVLIAAGPLQIRWYGLMYILGFTFGYLLLKKRSVETQLNLDKAVLMDFCFYLFLGVLIGGRIGYILFYNPLYFVSNPFELIALWHGGMSFHGGMIGIMWGAFAFCYQRGISFYQLADATAPCVPIGLGLGRLGNFINGELWGRPSDVPWAMVFPADPLHVARHPSQLYEFTMEGLILFTVLWGLRNRRLPLGTLYWTFIALYGLFRFVAEQFREPDAQLSFILPHVTAGMILSAPMLVIGVVMIAVGFRRRTPPALASGPDMAAV